MHIKCLIGLICQDLKTGSLARDVLLPQWMGKIRICYLIFMTMALHSKHFHLVPLMVMGGSNMVSSESARRKEEVIDK